MMYYQSLVENRVFKDNFLHLKITDRYFSQRQTEITKNLLEFYEEKKFPKFRMKTEGPYPERKHD